MEDHTTLLTTFNELVALKYQIYNGLFITLPFEDLPTVGAELPFFSDYCKQYLLEGMSPDKIVDDFFKNVLHIDDLEQRNKILFLWLQFVERQVVLFDALEDAAFKKTHNMDGYGSVGHLLQKSNEENRQSLLLKNLKEYRARLVLTAHPTQFYPPEVLGIIQDLSAALQKNKIGNIRKVLLQLGKTSFKNPKKPTPIDEASILITYLENNFYPAVKSIHYQLYSAVKNDMQKDEFLPSNIELGFWPGGDRDGNPNVTTEITMEVALRLKLKIISIYIQEIQLLRKRLTFPDMWEQLDKIQRHLIFTKQAAHGEHEPAGEPYSCWKDYYEDLMKLRNELQKFHQNLFIEQVDQVIIAVIAFGFHFATLDLRQDSRVHVKVFSKLLALFNIKKDYQHLAEQKKIALISKLLSGRLPELDCKAIQQDDLMSDVIDSFRVLVAIQRSNGERGMNRYIISNSKSVSNVLEIMILAQWAGLKVEALPFDIAPLFESITDLENAPEIMDQLFSLTFYKKHLKQRNNQQHVMLGFSDGTKDGGFLCANWAIYQCKIKLYECAKLHGIDIIFFDGRGGPPARGGGNTHHFYRALESVICQKQIQLTIQGQTISSKFGSLDSCQYNLEQFLTSGLFAHLFGNSHEKLSDQEVGIMQELSKVSLQAYSSLKQHPKFLSYLEVVTPLKFYGELNIASRPPKRGGSKELSLEDLRAIPFVGAWAQMKQNVPGFYGVGTALKKLIDAGKLNELQQLYNHSLFFRALLANAMMSLCKSNFSLTQYLDKNKEYSQFWRMLKDEADLSVKMLEIVSGEAELLLSDPLIRASIQLREDLVLPLLVIQQYAMIKNWKRDQQSLHNMILKSLAANINASRNSA